MEEWEEGEEKEEEEEVVEHICYGYDEGARKRKENCGPTLGDRCKCFRRSLFS